VLARITAQELSNSQNIVKMHKTVSEGQIILTAPLAVLGGLVVSVLATGPKVCGIKPDRGDTNPQHTFLWSSKAVGSTERDFIAC
jgi:hypothetical protein